MTRLKAPIIKSLAAQDYQGDWAYPSDFIRMTAGKYAGQYALKTKTVTLTDGKIILRKYAGHSVYTVTPGQWEPATGDIVTLSETGKRRYYNDPSNPHGINGTIDAVYSSNHFRVKWNNGYRNGYAKLDLALVELQSSIARKAKEIAHVEA